MGTKGNSVRLLWFPVGVLPLKGRRTVGVPILLKGCPLVPIGEGERREPKGKKREIEKTRN
jgi:hypothetical protein